MHWQRAGSCRNETAGAQVAAAGSSGDSSGGSGTDGPELGVPKEDGEKSRVIFHMAHGVAFGEQVKVVGDGPVLGNWDITQAPSGWWTCCRMP
jgi:Starch binding domain